MAEPSSDTQGVGAELGEKLPTPNAESSEEPRAENLAEVRAGVMNATATKVATIAPQPRFTFEHQLQTMLVHCLPATHDVVWLALCTAWNVNCTDADPPCKALDAASGSR